MGYYIIKVWVTINCPLLFPKKLNLCYTKSRNWLHGREVRHGSAKPSTAVRVCLEPPQLFVQKRKYNIDI
jgi:hypothetical protein